MSLYHCGTAGKIKRGKRQTVLMAKELRSSIVGVIWVDQIVEVYGSIHRRKGWV
jgi:hypothetical protein